MSLKSRSVSRPVLGGTISIDASYAQELVEFWTQKYEQVKGELDQIREASVAASSSPRLGECVYDEGTERDSELSSATEYEDEFELDALRARNEDLRDQLATSEQQRWALLRQNAALASEAGVLRQQKINSIYPPVAFFPARADLLIFQSSSPQAPPELSADMVAGHPICFLSRPPACMPLRVAACGRHGYWFAPVITYPEDVEFELVVEGKATEWTYLGKYKSVYLPGGEMRLSEWLALDDETKAAYCARVAAQRLGRDVATPAAVSAAASELRRQYESGQATVPCFTLVCTGFTPQDHIPLRGATTRKRKYIAGPAGVKRIKREAN